MVSAAVPAAALAVVALAGAAAVTSPPTATPPRAVESTPGSEVETSAKGARWAWPLRPRPEVVAPFEAPTSRWGPGHRGIDLAGSTGEPVRATADGVVTHRGRVAGRGTVTVTHADGVRSTYEPVAPAVETGDRVGRGQRLGTLSPEPGHCAPSTCLHVGALRGRDYLDPRPFFGGVRVILLPVPRG
ncbi:M23 family metallopeptidase [Janibacter sp. UYMM211]|uniref:M23 family metallopeptidase n=1 Tax=unclassified Janibacter TaxID=2649294 RepID=UPI0033945665